MGKNKKLIVDVSFLDSMRFAFGIMAPQILKQFNICVFDPKLTKYFYQIVDETVDYCEKHKVKRDDFMDSLIHLMNADTEGKKLSLNQIAAQVFLFYIAGFETSAMTISFCMYELAKQPDIQQKVRDEILNVLQENDGEATYEAINNMSYTDKVIQETLRMYPPIVMLNRIVTRRHRVAGSALVLDEGTHVVISTLGVHYDPEFYPEPHRFDPERFSEEQKAKRPPMTYFPFGDGPRICLGQKFAMIEIKLALMVFLRQYKYSVHPSTPAQVRTISHTNVLGLKDKIWIKPTRI